jgi:class 3 adenylate cyclase/tetratricopeptide (TPR) repeat protein
MRCSRCSSDNRDGCKFCTSCRTSLLASCPKCGAPIQPVERFCGECGAALDDAAQVIPAQSLPVKPSADGERRHLTVLFCDLVGSTEIATRLDPEEWRETVAAYHRAAAEAITRYGGHVAKYLGDGVMAYFGWPEAHENDAERATRAGLAIIDALSKLDQQAGHPRLAARVGIDSGTVVVGAGAGRDADVFGEAPNIAARVQSVAEPDTVLVTAATHRLISGLFVVEEHGAQELKGVAKPVELYRVLRPTGVRGRLAAARGLTPFVGREEELRLLLNRWERAREGEGQLVLIVGEAGIGKSRLVAEFHHRIRDTPHIWMESAGEQFFENTPFHAITEVLSRWLELQGATSPCEGVERLERALASAGLKLDEAVPLVAELLQLPVGEGYPCLALVPEQKRRRLFAALIGWIFGAARLQPMVMAVEDLHWLDPSTLELLQLLAEQGATVPLMLLYTARPELRAPWPMRPHHSQITLNRLSARDVREMVALVAARDALASESVDIVVERTGGVPLFVEELTRAVLESGSAKLVGREIPVTLHDSLMARLDRLGSAKDVLQLGSVIGGEFSYQLLHAVHPSSEQELESELRKLTDADLLYFRGIAPEATYQFKHALIRDAAYEALLKSRRKELHRLLAHTIEEQFPDIKEAHPEVLARHQTEAGEPEAAVTEWTKAARTAQARSAFREALDSYQHALKQLNLLPESLERDRRELELRQAVVQILWMMKGEATSESVAAIQRAAALAEKTGDLGQVVNSIIARQASAFIAGDLSRALSLADQALELALREDNPINLGLVYMIQTGARFTSGDLEGSEKHFSAGLQYFDNPGFRQFQDGVVRAFGFASLNAWTLGRADIARARLARLTAEVTGNNAWEVGASKLFAIMLCLRLKEYDQAEALAVQLLEHAEKNHLALMAAQVAAFLGHVRAHMGRTTEGIALIRRGISGLLELGSRVTIAECRRYVAEALALESRLDEALETVEHALREDPHKTVHHPEILRVRGELRLKLRQIELAESDLHKAIALARTMSAKFHELRATMSLARLLAKQGRRDEAHSMLAEIYNWFTEGFDTADLKDAKALLDELSS